MRSTKPEMVIIEPNFNLVDDNFTLREIIMSVKPIMPIMIEIKVYMGRDNEYKLKLLKIV